MTVGMTAKHEVGLSWMAHLHYKTRKHEAREQVALNVANLNVTKGSRQSFTKSCTLIAMPSKCPGGLSRLRTFAIIEL
jgi:hypothetical protein